MPTRFFMLAIALGAGWGAQIASAGELTLFGREQFERRSVVLREAARDLSRADVPTRVGSMIVESGRWEMCTQPDFLGDCFIVEPGEYRELGRLVSNVASLRQLEASKTRANPRREPGVELFEGESFRGLRVIVQADLDTLHTVGFNDRAGSLIVYGGRWEFCQHKDFGGLCLTYGPGRYEHLGGLHREISSIRRVR